MKQFFFWIILAFSASFSATAIAQQNTQSAWIQIEAQPSLREARQRTRAYAGVFENVNGFAIGSGWYAVILGPFTPDAAAAKRRELRRENLIPRDSFVVDGNGFGQQFWPVGANTLNQPPVVAPETTPAAPIVAPAPAPAVVAPPPVVDETPRQARESERELNREQRKLLQTALQWKGFYNAAIDGAFGRGTRQSMTDYQQSMGHDPTGILTTKQRAELLQSYNAILAGIGLATVRNESAGIEIDLPMAMVEFSKYEPPFAHYDAKNNSGVQVLLISQTGDRATLFGLYDIMQTLSIVPLQGARSRKKTSFELSGQDDEIHSYTYAALKGGMIKGFTLIWPVGDEKRRGRVIEAMKASFAPFGTTALDEMLGNLDESQRIDLLAGLEIRTPVISRSGFFVDAGGKVLTTVDAVQNCKKITLDNSIEAKISFVDEALGIALLKPLEILSPTRYANFRNETPRLNSEIAIAGYSFQGALHSATMTFGRLADIRGLRGEPQLRRLSLVAQDGDAGGPVFDMSGRVLGMLLPKLQKDGQRLPREVSFAISAEAMGKILAQNGVSISATQSSGAMAAEDLTTIGVDMTVLVSCWD